MRVKELEHGVRLSLFHQPRMHQFGARTILPLDQVKQISSRIFRSTVNLFNRQIKVNTRCSSTADRMSYQVVVFAWHKIRQRWIEVDGGVRMSKIDTGPVGLGFRVDRFETIIFVRQRSRRTCGSRSNAPFTRVQSQSKSQRKMIINS